MTPHYDKEGRSISLEEFAHLKDDESYWRIARDKIDAWEVSTVWVGRDMGFSEGGRCPLIFETATFWDDEVIYVDRYWTERQAREGHAQALAKVQSEMQDEPAETADSDDVKERPDDGPAI